MTSEIKQRIEQIRRGEVPEGYKKIHGDIVPLTWHQISLADCIVPYEEKTSVANQYPVLTSSRKGLMLQTDYYSNRQVTTEDNVGYNIIPFGYITFRSRSDDGRFKFNQNSIIDRGIISYFYPVFTFSDGVSCEFLLQLLNHTIYKKMFPYAEGTAQQVLSLKKLGRFKYPVPQIHEQQKIATVLSSQDKLVELKEKLLAEKQRQKKYLMQQLLTGKRRLPGFEGVWKYIPAREIFKSITDKKHSGDIQVLSSTQDRGIVPRDQVGIDIKYEADSLSSYKKVEKGNFVISLRSFQGGIEYSDYTGIVSPAYTVLKSIEKISDEYYKQFFKSTDYINRLNIAVYGIRDGKQISYEDFGRIKIPYPALDEQIAIAKVLSTADRENDLLRQDIEQEKQKKKALMQLLLTGIVRVTPCH
ncbi:restriction endonuclease subunit S [uncultured Gemmiger sp.]|uniref:restriction endonuclease subunit S n=1 Tax=uncultured Gemmiger sp. TaxID=1623490 RepID=UPI0025FB597F|nr:restriction endonuclease subunit S [uncultured Gemmiger sp.]